MFVAEIVAHVEAENILDACSSPGCKACQTAELLKGSDNVDETDIHEHKIDLIEHNIRKLRLKNVTAFKHDATTPYDAKYDKILVDAPCSGLGVLRHKPEINYPQNPETVDGLVDLQLEIMN